MLPSPHPPTILASSHIYHPSRTFAINFVSGRRKPLCEFGVFALFLLYLLVPLVNGRPIPNGVDEPSTTPISYIQYGVDNSTIFEQLSRNAFMSLQSESYIEPPLLTPEEKKARWLQRKLRKQQKMDRKSKKIAASPKDALKQSQLAIKLGDAASLRRSPQCEGQLFKQRIRMEGCLSKVVINRFCHGTCSSYFIPRLRPRKLKLQAIFQSCSACRPSDYDTIEVKLDCPSKEPSHLIRRVVKVKKCSCMALNLEQSDEELDGSLV